MTDLAQKNYHDIAEQLSDYCVTDATRRQLDVNVRAMRPDDKYAMKDIYPTLSQRTLYMRFFRIIETPTLDQLSRFVDMNFTSRIGCCVTLPNTHQLVGAGRLLRAKSDSDIAELSCIVVDDYQSKGIGRVLLNHLFAMGKCAGVKTILALVHNQNQAMLRLLKSCGYPVEVMYDDGEFEVTLDLTRDAPSNQAIDRHVSIAPMHQGVDPV
ncbi:GNAT family N-acetyltransferase [Paraferrimonas haliotis]|nr:GNAT family N-acetyltransferase [Paraferrimonas haliotis]